MEGAVVSHAFDKSYWEHHWSGTGQGHTVTAHPTAANPHLVGEVGELAPGTALDAGCGHGAEAVWLAARGWQVTAVDISATALRHVRRGAETVAADVATRITWVEADLTTWTPPQGQFDLVTTHYVHPATSHLDLLGRLAAWVAPGGTLLVVGHGSPQRENGATHMPASAVAGTAEDLVTVLDRDRWDVLVAENRLRTVSDPHGRETTLHDVVLRARRRP